LARHAGWDLPALLAAADPRASLPERHLWFVRLFEWLRHEGATAATPTPPPEGAPRRPRAVLRLTLLLAALEGDAAMRAAVQALWFRLWDEADGAALFADLGFGPRFALRSELGRRLRLRVLPGTPDTRDGAALFALFLRPADAAWIAAIDSPLLERLARLLGAEAAMPRAGTPQAAWRAALLDALVMLAGAVHAAGVAAPLRQRMERALLAGEPFRQLPRAAEAVRAAVAEGRHAEALRDAAYLRALLDAGRRAAASVLAHLEAYGVSVDVVFELEQVEARMRRIESLLEALLVPAPAPAVQHLVGEGLHVLERERGIRPLLARQYSLLARLVAERSAETGEHYITRDRAEWRAMLARAAGGGAVIAGTTFAKFAIGALGMTVFWAGFWSGVNYAASFVIVMLLHWTVATKQPAMTAPAMAACLPPASPASPPLVEGAAAGPGAAPAAAPADDEATEAFVTKVAQLMRSQVAGILGNVLACAPIVALAQWAAIAAAGEPLVGRADAEHVLHALTVLGPAPLYAAFTGVLLFASSLVAGWAENAFVFHRLDSAIAWNPRLVALVGAPRAARWAAWWRRNVSGLAANVSLGMMLGLVPAVFAVLALPVEVRHVTLSTGQLAAAAVALGPGVLAEGAFWWCVAGVVLTGALNVGVSFWLAFKVALRSRGLQRRDRSRVRAALRRRLVREPASFLWPPKDARAEAA
jgi:site-specific recombinase